MQVPKSPCLFGQTITAKPCILVITGVIKTANAITNGIGDLSFLYELFHGCTVKKEIAVRIGSIDAYVSFGDIFLWIFAVFTSLCTFFIGIIE